MTGPDGSSRGRPRMMSTTVMRKACRVPARWQRAHRLPRVPRSAIRSLGHRPHLRLCSVRAWARPATLADVIGTIAKILLSSSISAGIHGYLWLRLIRPAHLPRRWRIAATLGLVAMYLSIPLTVTSRLWAPELSATRGGGERAEGRGREGS